ncbi:F-box protein At5g18160 [Capsella rubella]|nr:F-box protein At5g18160 [Capsella rubella]
MFSEVLSRTPFWAVEKFRFLNKECSKTTYTSKFLKLNLERTETICGYFLQYSRRLTLRSFFVEALGNEPGGTHEVSLDFLPMGITIEACDASHGILLCVDDRPLTEYIICKPTTKQYLVLPQPKNQSITVATGLMVIGSNPFRYKILRLSHVCYMENQRYTFNTSFVCEVFDSDTFAWKRLNNLELVEGDMLSYWNSKPTSSYGFLHWLTRKHVIRFCFETEAWSYSPVPEDIASGNSQDLSSYEGKLAIISSRTKDGLNYEEVWVLKSPFGGSWVNVKEFPKDLSLKTVGFLSNDVVTLADKNQICLRNMNNGESEILQIRAPNYSPPNISTIFYFLLFSDHKRVEFDARPNDSE